MPFNFDKKDVQVFHTPIEGTKEPVSIPSHLLSYDHNTWTGYVRSKNNKPEDDEFSKRLKGIARGR